MKRDDGKGKRRHGVFGYAAFSSYSEFRYGNRLRPIHVPGSAAPCRLLKSEQRESVIDKVTNILKDWKTTPFEHEGSVHAGLRSGFCLDGATWGRADLEAATIVCEALSRIRAKRPSWEEGQRTYVVPRENCKWCGADLPEEELVGGRQMGFCSDFCARSAVHHWDFQTRTSNDRSYRLATDAVVRHRLPTKGCEQCGRKFRTKHKDARFCSEACSIEYNATRRHQQTCKLCNKPFLSALTHAGYCSATCRSKYIQLERGDWRPKRLSPVVFDFFVTLPINAARPTPLTAKRFDDLVAA